MQTNNHKINDYDKVLDATFGEVGTQQRLDAEEKAYTFYTGQIIGGTSRIFPVLSTERPSLASPLSFAS